MDMRILQYADAMPIKRSVKKDENQKVVGSRDDSGASAKSGAARANGVRAGWGCIFGILSG